MKWKYPYTVLSLCVMAFFVTFFARVVFSPVVPLITDDFQISNAQIGVGFMGLWVAYGVAQFPSGLLADKFGDKTIILVSLGGTSVVSSIIAGAPVYWVVVIGMVILGAVAGLHYSVATVMLTKSFEDTGSALGIHSLGPPLAGLLAPAVGAWVGVRFGWRFAIALTVVIGVPAFVLFFWRIDASSPRSPDKPIRKELSLRPLISVFTAPAMLFTTILGIISYFVIIGVLSFLPAFLVEFRGQSPELAGIVFSAYFLFRAVLQVGVGRMSDRVGRDAALGLCMLGSALGIGLYIYGTGVAAVVLATILAGLGASFFPALDPRFLDHMSGEDIGTEFGLVRTVYVMVGSLGSVMVGVFADLFNWEISFLVLGVLSLVMVGLLVINWAMKLGY